MLAELRAFMAGPLPGAGPIRAAQLEWGLQAQTRPLAQAAINELGARFE
jgi:hypothetical protein